MEMSVNDSPIREIFESRTLVIRGVFKLQIFFNYQLDGGQSRSGYTIIFH